MQLYIAGIYAILKKISGKHVKKNEISREKPFHYDRHWRDRHLIILHFREILPCTVGCYCRMAASLDDYSAQPCCIGYTTFPAGASLYNLQKSAFKLPEWYFSCNALCTLV